MCVCVVVARISWDARHLLLCLKSRASRVLDHRRDHALHRRRRAARHQVILFVFCFFFQIMIMMIVILMVMTVNPVRARGDGRWQRHKDARSKGTRWWTLVKTRRRTALVEKRPNRERERERERVKAVPAVINFLLKRKHI